MEADQVIKKILTDAKAEADEILKQADERNAAEQAKVDEQLNAYREQTKTRAQKAAEDEKAHILAGARMEIAKELLGEKVKILDEVFDQARKQLLEMPNEQYVELMGKLMASAVVTGDEEVVVDASEKRIDHEFVKQINRRLGPGYQGNLRLSDEHRDIGGGFILTRGKIKTNVSVGVMLEQAREELEIELAKELFG